jgi:hypothetical protein
MTPVRMWIGLVLLALGVIGIVEAAGTDTGTLADWWPVAVIGLGLVSMVGRRRVSLGPLVIVALGVVLLADQLSWTDEDLFGPALLVVFGLAVLLGLSRSYGGERDSDRSSFAMFGATKVKERSEHLRRADATAVFGGVTLDLREAHIDDKASVEALALFGGVDILVPTGWRVAITGTPILGGFEDKTLVNEFLPADAPVLNVNGVAIFGGVTVANHSDEERQADSRPQDRRSEQGV